jgi:hypothetical protein
MAVISHAPAYSVLYMESSKLIRVCTDPVTRHQWIRRSSRVTWNTTRGTHGRRGADRFVPTNPTNLDVRLCSVLHIRTCRCKDNHTTQSRRLFNIHHIEKKKSRIKVVHLGEVYISCHVTILCTMNHFLKHR